MSSWIYKLRMCSPPTQVSLIQTLVSHPFLAQRWLWRRLMVVEGSSLGGQCSSCTLHGPCSQTVQSWGGKFAAGLEQ